MSRTCGGCEFFRRAEPNGFYGACHRYAPMRAQRVVIPARKFECAEMGVWPVTDADDFCGEFSPRPVPDPPQAEIVPLKSATGPRLVTPDKPD